MAGVARKAETDVEVDANQAHTRAEGGVESPEQPDQEGTTGTAPSEGFVGRVAGQDEGYADQTGAERRAEEAKKADQADDESEESFPASDPPANY